MELHPAIKVTAREAIPRYYLTVLSNLVRGYDKYGRSYDKSGIPESTFPDRFFLLPLEDLHIGIEKARHLLAKTKLDGDSMIALQTCVPEIDLRPNLRTGLGKYLESSRIKVDAVYLIGSETDLKLLSVEEACARSYQLAMKGLPNFTELAPRSVSVLPVARACQASCPFCFSKASASVDTQVLPIDWARVRDVLQTAASRGAKRAVITGGGEPTLMSESDLLQLIEEASRRFPKVVLITNGYKWAGMTPEDQVQSLFDLADSGLSVLAISRHHHNAERNAKLMGLDTGSERLASVWAETRASRPNLALRFICVLQRGGVEDRQSLESYLDWATACGVDQICFKELYVSTSVESEYHDRKANHWSASHQVPLSLVTDLAREAGWTVRERLPWGAPIFEGLWRNRLIRVAAYTEPSLLWELKSGVCRSWNLMADGRCLASLEARNSEVMPRGLHALSAMA